MKKMLTLLALTTLSAACFANVTPAERVTLTANILSNVSSGNVGLNNGGSINVSTLSKNTFPVQMTYDLNQPVSIGFYSTDASGKQFDCTFTVLTTKNADGSYHTTIKPDYTYNAQCSVSQEAGGNDYSPTLQYLA